MNLDARTRLFIILAGIFSTCLVVGDIVGSKLVQTTIFGQLFVTTVGMIAFPVTFLLTDVLNEFYGKRAARFVTFTAFGCALLAFTIIFLAGAVPIAELARAPDYDGVTESAFALVFLGSQRMLLASLAAYLVSQLVDIGVFHSLRRLTRNRLLWLRATGSTLVSQLIDTVTISYIAWTGTTNEPLIPNFIASGYTLKVMIAVGLTPLVYLAHALVERGLGIRPVFLSGEAAAEVPLPARD